MTGVVSVDAPEALLQPIRKKVPRLSIRSPDGLHRQLSYTNLVLSNSQLECAVSPFCY